MVVLTPTGRMESRGLTQGMTAPGKTLTITEKRATMAPANCGSSA